MSRLTLLLGLALVVSGCSQIELSPQGDPARVLTGRIETGKELALPADAVVVVRVVSVTGGGQPPQVLGSQTLQNPGSTPVAFRIEYRAEDEVLRRGLNIEGRISYGGKVRFYNVDQYVVTLATASSEHDVLLNPAGP